MNYIRNSTETAGGERNGLGKNFAVDNKGKFHISKYLIDR